MRTSSQGLLNQPSDFMKDAVEATCRVNSSDFAAQAEQSRLRQHFLVPEASGCELHRCLRIGERTACSKSRQYDFGRRVEVDDSSRMLDKGQQADRGSRDRARSESVRKTCIQRHDAAITNDDGRCIARWNGGPPVLDGVALKEEELEPFDRLHYCAAQRRRFCFERRVDETAALRIQPSHERKTVCADAVARQSIRDNAAGGAFAGSVDSFDSYVEHAEVIVLSRTA